MNNLDPISGPSALLYAEGAQQILVAKGDAEKGNDKEANPKLAEAIGILTRLHSCGLLDQAMQNLQALEDEMLYQPNLPADAETLNRLSNGSLKKASVQLYRLFFNGKLGEAVRDIETLADKLLFEDVMGK